MSNFATIMELVVKYISILVIIYMGTDNPSAPLGIAIICALFSNPLLFIQVSIKKIFAFCWITREMRSGHWAIRWISPFLSGSATSFTRFPVADFRLSHGGVLAALRVVTVE